MEKKFKNTKKFRFSEHFAFGEQTPLFFSIGETEEIVQILENSIESIKKSKSPRLVVLETWLILDYFIRHFIISGLNLDKFSDENFDLAFELLPQSFRNCLDFLEKFIKKQKELSPNPENNKIDFYGKFAYFLIKKHQAFYDDQFIPIVREYYKKYYPELLSSAKTLSEMKNKKESPDTSTNTISTEPSLMISYPKTYREVNGRWLDIAIQFNKEWFKNVGKINDVRNQAAHIIKSEKIYCELGVSGKNEEIKFKRVKKFCIQQISELLDITISKRKYKKFL